MKVDIRQRLATLLVSMSLALYGVSFALKAVSQGDGEASGRGLAVFCGALIWPLFSLVVMPPMGLALLGTVFPSWLANPAYVYALVQLRRGRRGRAAKWSGIAVGLGLTILLTFVWSSATFREGYWCWIVGMALIVPAAALRRPVPPIRPEEKPEPQDARTPT